MQQAIVNTSTISFTKYVDIVSQVANGQAVQIREYIGRIFTTNPLLPPDSYIEFTSLAQCGSYFGTSSEEYARTQAYFSRVSKAFTTPDKISFARWVNADTAPMIFGTRLTTSLSQFQAISNGCFSLTLGTETHILSSIDLTAATSLADVASILQNKIQAADVDTQWASATVTYNPTSGSFNLVGGNDVAAVVSATDGGVGTALLPLIGWVAASGAIFADGALTQSITEVLTESANASNNFGTFCFMPYLDLSDAEEAAVFVDTQNVKFIFSMAVAASDVSTYQAALATYSGVDLTLQGVSGNFSDQYCMEILAAIDFTQPNSVQSFAYQQFPGDTPTVSDDTTANAYDAINVNYLGITQQAGQQLAWYQNGNLQGIPTDPIGMGIFANEIWLKDSLGAQFVQLQLIQGEIPANIEGESQLAAVSQSVIDQALFNGVISVGKPLTALQKANITTITNDPSAWYQVQNIGYWIQWSIDAVSNIASYILVYSKNDAILKVVGQHFLI